MLNPWKICPVYIEDQKELHIIRGLVIQWKPKLPALSGGPEVHLKNPILNNCQGYPYLDSAASNNLM